MSESNNDNPLKAVDLTKSETQAKPKAPAKSKAAPPAEETLARAAPAADPREIPEAPRNAAGFVVDDRPSVVRELPADYEAPDQETDPEGYAAYVAQLNAIRKPFGAFMQKLARPMRPGYHRHWFNDDPGWILQAKKAGYTFVKDHSTGRPEEMVVGTRRDGGGALKAFLMEIPQQLWEADHKETHKRADQIEAAIRRSQVIAKTEGDASEDAGGFYVPGRGSKVENIGGSRTT